MLITLDATSTNKMIAEAISRSSGEQRSKVCIKIASTTRKGVQTATRAVRIEICKMLAGLLTWDGKPVKICETQKPTGKYRFWREQT